jgi:hypothetical protein
VPGDEDDRKSHTCFRELLLKREPAHPGQPYVGARGSPVRRAAAPA